MNNSDGGAICALFGLVAFVYLTFVIIRGIRRDGLRYFVTDLFVVIWRWLDTSEPLGVLKGRLVRGRAERAAQEQAKRRQAETQRREESQRKTRLVEQKRREDARAECELLYFRHSVFLKERFPKEEMQEYFGKYMGDDKPVEHVEERGRQLRQLIEQKLDDKSRRTEERTRKEDGLKKEGERLSDERKRLAEQRAALESEARRIEEQERRLAEEDADRASRPATRDIDPESI